MPSGASQNLPLEVPPRWTQVLSEDTRVQAQAQDEFLSGRNSPTHLGFIGSYTRGLKVYTTYSSGYDYMISNRRGKERMRTVKNPEILTLRAPDQ